MEFSQFKGLNEVKSDNNNNNKITLHYMRVYEWSFVTYFFPINKTKALNNINKLYDRKMKERYKHFNLYLVNKHIQLELKGEKQTNELNLCILNFFRPPPPPYKKHVGGER